MKKIKIALALAVAALVPAAAIAQYGACFHTVNDLGVWYYSFNSAQQAIAVCQVNTPAGYSCYYKGYY